ncbi:peritrophin-1 [Drosophila nasuta]|uniref:peritrophin-1 n=1 Tax=Drosophila nasuta TaxID=42062 RepID=UPI00295EE8E1|nr:peritrophin-1 [Drosophila nasuta]
MLKFFWSTLLLVVALASCSYGNIYGFRVEAEPPIQMSQCPAYDDPNHLVMLSYPNNCRKYYTCLKGLAHAHQCPENYYWSQLTYRCDFKQYSNCEQTYEYPTLVQEIEQYSPYPGDCNLYYENRILRCPVNYHWNAQTQRCDLPQFAGCAAPTPQYPTWNPITPAIVPTAATPPTVIPFPNESTVPIDPAYYCSNTGQGNYLPYPGDCHKFIYCGPIATVLYCPEGLFWNRNTQSCDLSTVGC